ncbi:MAG: hypothetical protein ABL883_13520 [Terricaulis sp.]
MKRLAFAVLAAVWLGGCVSMLDDAYDEQARSQCERESRPSERGECLDRVDRIRRERN